MNKQDLHYKGFSGSYEISFEDKCLHGKILFINDLVTYEGTTTDELQEAFLSAVDRYLAHCKKTGQAANKPYSGTFNVRIGSDLHKKAAQTAFKQGLGLNEYVTKVIADAIHNDGVSKIEHVHQHFLTVDGNTAPEIRVVTTQEPLTWEAYATIQ